VGSRWAFVGRASEVGRIESLVRTGVGALVLGDSGVGKTALVRHVEELLRVGGMTVGHVFGRAVSNGTPLEAFAGLLTAADTSLRSPVEVARRVREAFPQADGAPLLFVVDDAQLLDTRSAQVLLQLASEGTATVLATARDLRVPEGVERLWRDGLCERIELDGLTNDEVAEVVETALAGPVEPAAAYAFAQRSRGNPLLLRELVSAALDASTLSWRGTGWTLRANKPSAAESTTWWVGALPVYPTRSDQRSR
jgi:type II secretory pathway predicted ATPase ExeA